MKGSGRMKVDDLDQVPTSMLVPEFLVENFS